MDQLQLSLSIVALLHCEELIRQGQSWNEIIANMRRTSTQKKNKNPCQKNFPHLTSRIVAKLINRGHKPLDDYLEKFDNLLAM